MGEYFPYFSANAPKDATQQDPQQDEAARRLEATFQIQQLALQEDVARHLQALKDAQEKEAAKQVQAQLKAQQQRQLEEEARAIREMLEAEKAESDAEVICVDDDEVEALDPEAPASAKHKEIAKLYNEEEFALFSRISKRKPWTTPHIPGYRWYVRVLSSTVLSVVLLKVDDVEAPPAHEIFLKPILAKANYVHPDGECSVELSKVITRGQTISAKRFMEIIEKNPIEVRADVRWHTYTGLHGKEETILCLGSLGTFMWVCHVLETLDDCCGYPYDLLENRTHNAVRVETAMGFYMDLHNIGRKEDGENDKQGTQNTGNNEDADNTGNNEDRHNTGKNDDGHNSGAQEDAAPGGDDTEAATPKPAGISIASLPPEILTNHKVVGILMSLDGKMIRGVVCRSDADIFHGSLHSIDCYMKIPRGSRQGLPKCQACYEYYRKILRSRPRCKAKEAGGDVPNKSKAHTQLSRSEMLGRLTVMSRQIRNMQKKLRYIETEMKGKRARDEESEDDDEEEDGSDANKKSRGNDADADSEPDLTTIIDREGNMLAGTEKEVAGISSTLGLLHNLLRY